MKQFNYQEAQKFLSDYWWLNPQDIESFEKKYQELSARNSRLPNNPREEFRGDVSFFAFSTLFGEEFFTHYEAIEYCSKEYLKLKTHVDLQSLLNVLRKKESRLPSNPAYTYQDKWTTWGDFFKVEQHIIDSPFYTLAELQKKCIEHLTAEALKPKNMQKFYQSFKHFDSRMPKNPYLYYKKTGDWVNWNDLFGLETANWAGYCAAKDFCIKKYFEEQAKPRRLADFYLHIRETYRDEIGLPRHPDEFYAKTNEWKSYKSLFGLD